MFSQKRVCTQKLGANETEQTQERLSAHDVIDCAGRYSLPPPSPFPLSSCFSVSLHLCRHCEKAWEWQEGGEAEEKEEKEEEENEKVEQLYANQDFLTIYAASFYLRQQVHFTLSFSASRLHTVASNPVKGK